MRENILFDLDGTLTESGPGIMNCARHALAVNGHIVPGGDVLRGFVGPPLHISFMEVCGLSFEEAEQCVESFRVRFLEKGILENALYPGVRELLEKLAADGKKLHLATSKPLHLAKMVLDNFDIARYFTSVSGTTMDLDNHSKADVVAEALEKNNITPVDAVMVGDRLHDVEGAAANGVATVGVLYGYGSRKELENAGAIRLARDTDELYGILTDPAL